LAQLPSPVSFNSRPLPSDFKQLSLPTFLIETPALVVVVVVVVGPAVVVIDVVVVDATTDVVVVDVVAGTVVVVVVDVVVATVVVVVTEVVDVVASSPNTMAQLPPEHHLPEPSATNC